MRRILIAAAIAACTIAIPNLAAAAGAVCPRYAAGSDVQPPPDIFSSGGKLHVALSYLTTVDDFGRTLFCYQTPDGLEAPTLHVQPGDVAQIDLTNMLPPGGDMHPVS